MAYTQKDLSGALWKNDKKREGKKDADYNGSATIGGREFWVDSWINNNPRSEDYDPQKKTFMSLSFRPKDKPAASKTPPARRAAPPRPPSAEPDPDTGMHDSEVPF